MRIISKWPFIARDSRNLERPPKWIDDLFIRETSSGVSVTEDTALNFSAVWASVNLLSTSVSQLPFQVFKRTADGKEIDREHPVYDLIHNSPNEYQSQFTFIQTIMNSVLLYGNAYALLTKDKSERVISMDFIHPTDVEVMVKGKVWYKVKDRANLIPARNMIHIIGLTTDGYTGRGVIAAAKDAIGLGMAAEQFGGSFFKNGANSEVAFTSQGKLDDTQFERLLKQIKERFTGLKNSHTPILLEGGGDVKQLTIPPDQAQFLETRKFQIEDIARWFQLPPHMIGSLEKATYSNIEQQSIQFVQYSLMPWIKRIEQEFNRKLFFEQEKSEYFCEANVDGLLRGDVKSRGEFYTAMWNIGAIKINEIRAFENLNAVEGGDQLFVPLNFVTLDKAINAPSGETISTGTGDTNAGDDDTGE